MDHILEFFNNVSRDVSNFINLIKKKESLEQELCKIHEILKKLHDDDNKIIDELREFGIDERRKQELLFNLESNRIQKASFEDKKYSKREMFEEIIKLLKD